MSDLTPEEGQPGAGDAGRHYGEDASPFQAKEPTPLLRRTFPVSAHLADYPKRSARHDIIAGLTIAALALPSGMAYAELAGLSPASRRSSACTGSCSLPWRTRCSAHRVS